MQWVTSCCGSLATMLPRLPLIFSQTPNHCGCFAGNSQPIEKESEDSRPEIRRRNATPSGARTSPIEVRQGPSAYLDLQERRDTAVPLLQLAIVASRVKRRCEPPPAVIRPTIRRRNLPAAHPADVAPTSPHRQPRCGARTARYQKEASWRDWRPTSL